MLQGSNLSSSNQYLALGGDAAMVKNRVVAVKSEAPSRLSERI